MPTETTPSEPGAARLAFSPIDALPDALISPGGVVSQAFLTRGLATFQAACRWVRAVPYGCHGAPSSSLVLFEEGRGNCMSKHGVVARLAGELGLDVQKRLGFYRLTEDIVTGIGALLAPHGLPFVPQIHCFLQSGSVFVDLTAGNETGKKQALDRFDFIVPVGPEPQREELSRLYFEQVARYHAIEPRFAAVDGAVFVEIISSCSRQVSQAAPAGPSCCA